MACDACRQRKVRCDGRPSHTCRQCSKHGLACTYNSSRDRSSRLGAVRGTVLALCAPIAPPSPDPSSPSASLLAGDPHWDTDDFYLRLVPRWMAYIYPVVPIVTDLEIRQHVPQRRSSPESAGLLYAWAAIVVFQEHFSELGQDDVLDSRVSRLTTLALDSCQAACHRSSFTLAGFITSLFVSWSMTILDEADSALFYMRQAITILQILQSKAQADKAKLAALYWMCFIHERHLALMYKVPICLDADPSQQICMPAASQQNLHCMIQTWLLVDRDFVLAWRGGEIDTISDGWIESKYRQFADENWFDQVCQLPLVQQTDLIVSRQWICTLLWQMAIARVQLSSNAAPNTMSLLTPLRLSRQLRSLLTRVQPQEAIMYAFDLNFCLFEIATAVGEVLLHLPTTEDVQGSHRRISDFLVVKNFLASFPRVRRVGMSSLDTQLEQIKLKYGLDRSSEESLGVY